MPKIIQNLMKKIQKLNPTNSKSHQPSTINHQPTTNIMKLLLITTIKEFEKNVKNLLVNSGVSVFSYTAVKGYKADQKATVDNWFAAEITESNSLMFMAFVEEDRIDHIYTKVSTFNTKQEFQSKIHIATLEIEKSI